MNTLMTMYNFQVIAESFSSSRPVFLVHVRRMKWIWRFYSLMHVVFSSKSRGFFSVFKKKENSFSILFSPFFPFPLSLSLSLFFYASNLRGYELFYLHFKKVASNFFSSPFLSCSFVRLYNFSPSSSRCNSR